MKRKYTLRGMGLGILVTALIFTIALLFEKPTLSDEEIKRQAAKLGMVDASAVESGAAVTTDGSVAADGDSASEASGDSGTDSGTDTAGTDAASGTDGVGTDSTADTSGTDAGTDSTVDSANGTDATADASGTDSSAGTDTQTLTAQQAEADAAAAEKALENGTSDSSAAYKGNTGTDSSSTSAAPTGTVSITITAGQDSAKVAENLYRAGLITDPIAFNDYLEQGGYDARIRAGTFQIPEGASFEKIANAISSHR